MNRFTTKNVVKCGILVTLFQGMIFYFLIKTLGQEIFILSDTIMILRDEISALSVEVRRQRTLLRVYSDSTSEHALMAHIINLMRANRVGVESYSESEQGH